jgi:hypothetical protein
MIDRNAELLEPFQVELNKFSASVFKFRYRKKPTAPDYALEVCNGFISYHGAALSVVSALGQQRTHAVRQIWQNTTCISGGHAINKSPGTARALFGSKADIKQR